MTRLVVDLAGLAELVERMGAFAGHLDALHADVDARVRALGNSWTGAAAAAEESAQARWIVASDEVSNALATLRAIVATAEANYRCAVATNRRMWAVR